MRASLSQMAVLASALSTFGGASAARAAALTGFLSKPTEQVAVPGMLADAEITPEGDLYTGWAEYQMRFGDRLRHWSQPTRTLPDAGVPLYVSQLDEGGVRYTLSVFAVPVAGRPVAYETMSVVNGSRRERTAKVSMQVAYTAGRQIVGPHGITTAAYRFERPAPGAQPGSYAQPGEAFSPSFTYSFAGRDMIRSGLLLARGPARRSSPVRTPAATSPASPHDARAYVASLRPGARLRLVWRIPLEPPPASTRVDDQLDAVPLPAARARLAAMWSRAESPMAQIHVPEKKVNDTYRASVAVMLSSRYETPAGWVQSPNRLQYKSFWIRDAAIITDALDLVGLHRPAAQNLMFMDAFQAPDGLFSSQAGQYDGLGEALWAISRHAQLTRSVAYARAQLERFSRAIEWLKAATAADPLGLLPAANPDDDEQAYGHITGQDVWAATGLRSAIATAKLAGRPAVAAAWSAVDRRFETSLRDAIDAAVKRTGHIPPVLDAEGGEDWGNYLIAYPMEILPADSHDVRATMAWARSHMAQGLATYRRGKSLHDYLGFRIFETELEAGEGERAVAGLYAELAHTTSTDEGWETDIAPRRSNRSSPSNLAPHGTFAAEYVALLRNMLIREAPGGGLCLLSGASPAWLAPGGRVVVRHAPTVDGMLSLTLRSSRGRMTLSWHGRLARGTPLRWTLPSWLKGAHTRSGPVRHGSVALHGQAGSATVWFAGRRPSRSYARAARALDASYRARGEKAPLVPAHR